MNETTDKNLLQTVQSLGEGAKSASRMSIGAIDSNIYAQSRAIAQHQQIIRLVYAAMHEGVFDGDVSLEVGLHGDKARRLTTVDELLDFVYSRDVDAVETLTLKVDGVSSELNDVSELWNGALKDAIEIKMGDDFSAANWRNFQYELLDSLNNETLAVYAKHEMHAELKETAQGYDNVWSWLTESPTVSEEIAGAGHDVDSLLLQLGAFSGHRTHPSTKMKLQVSPQVSTKRDALRVEEVQHYSPEFAPDVPLAVVAMKKDNATTCLSADNADGYQAYFADKFPKVYAEWKEALAKEVGAEHIESYLPVPIHPLQLPEVKHRFAEQIDAGDVVIVPDVHIDQRPTLSFRTLTPVGNPDEPQIKTTVNMQMTSVVRTLAPSRLFNAPVLSDMMSAVLDKDAQLSSTLRVLGEKAAVYFGQDTNPDSKDYKDGYHLAALFKDNPAQLVHENEVRMPVSTLLSESPLSGEHIITDIMKASGVTDAESAKQFFADYAHIVVNSDVGMLAKYGIGLEGHQQNTDIVFDKAGHPTASVYRDVNGGVDCCTHLLKLNNIDCSDAIHPVTKGMYAEIDEPLKQTMHTTFAMHLFPVVSVVAQDFGVPKTEFYAELRKAVENTINEARTQHIPDVVAPTSEADKGNAEHYMNATLDTISEALLSRDMETKCLLKMRVAQTPDIEFRGSENPLAR